MKDSVALNAVKMGEGHPLVMLHGWGRNLEHMRPLGELLAAFFNVHLLDLPGFGRSDMPNGDWDTQRYAERVAEYLRENRLSRVDLAGHSFGGRVSLRLAAGFPDLVRRLVLMGSHGLTPKRTGCDRLRVEVIPRVGRVIRWFDRAFSRSLFEKYYVPRFGSSDYRTAGALRGTLVKVIKEDQSEEAKKIHCPTLLLWGDKDTETPLEMGKRFSRLIPDSRLIVLPHRNHHLFDDISSHLCALYIKKFLGDEVREAVTSSVRPKGFSMMTR